MTSFAPFALTLLRVVAGALLLQHGLIKLFGFPPDAAPGYIDFHKVFDGTLPPVMVQLWIGGVIEAVTGTLLILGLLTRLAAFLASGLTAVAYWQFHFKFPGYVFPAQAHGGEQVILYCFIFFYILFAGPGLISVDGLLGGSSAEKK